MNSIRLGTGRFIPVGFAIAAVLPLASCNPSPPNAPSPDGDTEQSESQPDTAARPVGWSEPTHGRSAAPDYDVVFPDDKVNRLDITIAPSDWQAMQDDMTETFGEPGSGVGGGPMIGGDGTPEELLGLCDGMEEGDACTGTLFGTDFAGTCFPMEPGTLGCFPEGGVIIGGPPGPGGEPGDFEGLPDEPPPMGGDANPIFVPCTVEFEGNTWWHVGIRFKGQSSLAFSWMAGVEKHPLRLDFDEFEDEHPEIDNQRFFGFKKLSLGNSWSDSSLMREKVAHDILRDAGLPAPSTAFSRVYVDHGEGPTYFGLYVMTEVPDDPFLQTRFGNDDGNLYKPLSDWTSFDEWAFDKETNQKEENWSDVEGAVAALHADRTDPAAWRAGLEATLNVDGFLRWLAVNTVIQNWDQYGNMAQNYYLYADPGDDGRLQWIPWDYNMSLAGDESGSMVPPTEDGEAAEPGTEPTDVAVQGENAEEGMFAGGLGGPLSLSLAEVTDDWPLIRYLADDPVYWAKYVSYVREASEGAFAVAPTQARYQAVHDLIAPYVVGPAGEQPGYTLLSGPQEFHQGLDGLMDHVGRRREAVVEFLETTP